MSMIIDLKGSAITAPQEFYWPVQNRLSVDRMLHDAIVDVEDGVEFWKTLGKYRHGKRGSSSEFLNRNG